MAPTPTHRASGGLAPDYLGPTVTIGEILAEIMAPDRGFGFLEPTALIGPFPSGAPAIFIDQCARMGGQAGIIASVGDDDFGRVEGPFAAIHRSARHSVEFVAPHEVPTAVRVEG